MLPLALAFINLAHNYINKLVVILKRLIKLSMSRERIELDIDDEFEIEILQQLLQFDVPCPLLCFPL